MSSSQALLRIEDSGGNSVIFHLPESTVLCSDPGKGNQLLGCIPSQCLHVLQSYVLSPWSWLNSVSPKLESFEKYIEDVTGPECTREMSLHCHWLLSIVLESCLSLFLMINKIEYGRVQWVPLGSFILFRKKNYSEITQKFALSLSKWTNPKLLFISHPRWFPFPCLNGITHFGKATSVFWVFFSH